MSEQDKQTTQAPRKDILAASGMSSLEAVILAGLLICTSVTTAIVLGSGSGVFMPRY